MVQGQGWILRESTGSRSPNLTATRQVTITTSTRSRTLVRVVLLETLVQITTMPCKIRRAREGGLGTATRRRDGGRSTNVQLERHAPSHTSTWRGRSDDKRVEVGCLPEQTTAYWDAALEPTQAASIGVKMVLAGRELGTSSIALVQFLEKGWWRGVFDVDLNEVSRLRCCKQEMRRRDYLRILSQGDRRPSGRGVT